MGLQHQKGDIALKLDGTPAAGGGWSGGEERTEAKWAVIRRSGLICNL